jgi:hypothetical protein
LDHYYPDYAIYAHCLFDPPPEITKWRQLRDAGDDNSMTDAICGTEEFGHLSSKPIIATWIVLDSADESSYYPQTGIKSSADPRVHEMYWRCVACFYAAVFRIVGDQCRPVLYTNSNAIPAEIRKILDDCGTEVEQVLLNHLPPPGYFGMWRNQFYILDVIRHMVQTGKIADCLVLDSDCLIVSALGEFFSSLQKEGVLTYGLHTQVDEDINGLSRLQMKSLYESMLGRELSEPPEYYGGEIFASTAAEAMRLNAEIDDLWIDCLRRADSNLPKLNEEAHLLSFLYLKLGYSDSTANAFIRRIWTQRRFRDGMPSDLTLPIWHLPAEKRFGYSDLYPLIVDRQSWFWSMPTDETWRLRIAHLMGVPRPTIAKKAKDMKRAAWDKVFQLT